MIVFRIARAKYAEDLSGYGAEKAGGRWNSPGNAVLYTSATASLALLECLAWTPLKKLLQSDFVLLEIGITAPTIEQITSEQLPINWNQTSQYPFTRTIGDKWLAAKSSHMLEVPSAILPIEMNYLISPNHQRAKTLKIKNLYDIELDQRILQTYN